MDRECYNSGQCKICGCKTTALQFANKPCDKPCYPKMMSKRAWKKMDSNTLYYCKKTDMLWGISEGKFFNIKWSTHL
jgi:hypothetical protein